MRSNEPDFLKNPVQGFLRLLMSKLPSLLEDLLQIRYILPIASIILLKILQPIENVLRGLRLETPVVKSLGHFLHLRDAGIGDAGDDLDEVRDPWFFYDVEADHGWIVRVRDGPFDLLGCHRGVVQEEDGVVGVGVRFGHLLRGVEKGHHAAALGTCGD